jgi:hypothetical protein
VVQQRQQRQQRQKEYFTYLELRYKPGKPASRETYEETIGDCAVDHHAKIQ